jgi:glycosyltransferase involved in cell wall biosynthesis
MTVHVPLVSVIVPAYNAEAFIEQTLNSVLSQTYRNIEVLVVDDGSQDRSAEIAKSLAQRDKRVILLQQLNKGVAAARNLAIQKSSGEYIAPIDADDIWDHQKLEKQVQCMLEAEPSVGLVYAWSVLIDEQGLPTGKYCYSTDEGEVYTKLLYYNFIGHASAPLIRRACLERVGYYNCKLKEQNGQGLEDWDLYLRLAERYQFRVVPEFLIGYRQVFGSMSRDELSMENSFHLIMASARQRHPEVPATILRKATVDYYLYLADKSKESRNYWRRLLWLYKALQADWVGLLQPRFYKGFIKTVVMLLASPITSLIWQDHRSWLQFKERLRSNLNTIED